MAEIEKRKKKKAFYIWMVSTVLWFCLITFMSHQDEIHSTAFSLKLVDRTVSFREIWGEETELTGDERWSMNLLIRKIAHFTAFAGLSFLLFMTLRTGGYRYLAGGVFCVAWSFLDELTKIFSPGRHADGPDIILNLAGTGAGILLFAVLAPLLSGVPEYRRNRIK